MKKKFIFAACMPLFIFGCGQPSEKANMKHTKDKMVASKPTSTQKRKIEVSEEIKNIWKEAKIFVKDKTTGDGTVYTAPLHSDLEIPGSGLTVKIGAFIPDFHMAKGLITSNSKELKNPALQVTIMENGKEAYRGWFFSKFPDMHAFEHPKYSLSLAEEMFQDVD